MSVSLGSQDTTREALVEVERTSRTLELRLQDEEVSLVAARKVSNDLY